MRWYYGMLLAACAATTWGCSEADVDSTAIRTEGIRAEFELVSNGSRTVVSAELRVGDTDSGTLLDLKGEDELVVTVDGEDRRMSGSDGRYDVEFPVTTGGSVFTIAFLRGAEDVGAPDTTATLPEGFTLSGIEPGATVSRDELATVTWEPSGTDDDMSWELDGDCLFEQSGNMGDVGTLDLTGTMYDVHAGDEDETCEVTLVIERSRSGSLDPNYGEGGSVVAIQRRTISFMSAPRETP